MTVAEDLIRLVAECKEYADAVEKEIAEPGNDLRKMCFWNIHNRVKITEEIMVMYERVWGSSSFPDVDEKISEELVERIVTITKDLYVDVVSIVEKTMKDSLRFYSKSGLKEAALRKTSHLYMRNILFCAMESGLIDQDRFREWDELLVLRNLAAHNNSIADRQDRFEIEGITVSMRPGRMMKGPINVFVVLTGRLIVLFYEWLSLLEERFSS